MKKVFALPLLFSAVTTSLITALPAPSLSQTATVPFISGTLGILGQNLSGCPSGACVFQPNSLTSASILTPLGQVNISAFNSGNISSTTKTNGTSLFNVNSSSITFVNGNQQNFLNQLVVNTDGNSASTLVFTGNTSGTASFTPTGAFNNASTTINAVFDTALVGNTNATIQVSVPITSGSIVLPIPTTPIVPSQNTTIPFISGTLGILGNNLGGCTSGCVLQPTALTGASILTPLGLVSIGNFNSGGISSTTALNGTSLFNVSASSIAFSTGDQQNFLNQEVVPFSNSASVLVFTGNTSGVAAFTPTGAFNNASTTINATFNTALPSAGLTQVSIPITSGSIVLPIADPSITPPPQNPSITPPPQNPSITPPPQNTPIAFAISTTPVNTDLLLALRSSTEINSDDLQKDKEDFSFSPFSSCRFLQTEDK